MESSNPDLTRIRMVWSRLVTSWHRARTWQRVAGLFTIGLLLLYGATAGQTAASFTLTGLLDCGAGSGSTCVITGNTITIISNDSGAEKAYVIDISWLPGGLGQLSQDDLLQFEIEQSPDGTLHALDFTDVSGKSGSDNPGMSTGSTTRSEQPRGSDQDDEPKSTPTATMTAVPSAATATTTATATATATLVPSTATPTSTASPTSTTTATATASPTATLTPTATATNVPPTAVNDTATVAEDSGATAIDVLANDTDPDGGTKLIASVTQPPNGTVAITGGGTGLTYTPNANFWNTCAVGLQDSDLAPGVFAKVAAAPAAPETFTYTLSPGGSTATVTMSVTCVDDPPVAVNDAVNAEFSGSSLIIPVLVNDTDIDGGPISITSATQPALGSVDITDDNTTVTYTPPVGCGSLSETTTFTYTISPGGSTATVTVALECT